MGKSIPVIILTILSFSSSFGWSYMPVFGFKVGTGEITSKTKQTYISHGDSDSSSKSDGLVGMYAGILFSNNSKKPFQGNFFIGSKIEYSKINFLRAIDKKYDIYIKTIEFNFSLKKRISDTYFYVEAGLGQGLSSVEIININTQLAKENYFVYEYYISLWYAILGLEYKIYIYPEDIERVSIISFILGF